MKLIVLRHGESESNDQNKFSGWIDVKLSAKGKQEAAMAGDLIKSSGATIRKMYTSKLTRSIQTGNIILDELNLLHIDQFKNWELNERHYGSFQGHNRKEIFEKVGADQYKYIRRDFNGKPPPIVGKDDSIDDRYEDVPGNLIPNGELLKDVMYRFIPFFENIIKSNSRHHDILIITHGSVVRSIVKYLGDIPDTEISNVEIPTGIPIIFEMDDNGKMLKPYYYLNKQLAMELIEKYKLKTAYKEKL